MVKQDLKDAFRHIPVATFDQWLLAFFCDDSYWLKQYLPFGLRTSPFPFGLFAKALHWIVVAVLSWTVVLHYLDNFFAILSPWADSKAYSFEFDCLCADLGLMVNHIKSMSDTMANFLGIELDSKLMQTKFSADKLARARNTVKDLLSRVTISHRKLESAVGFVRAGALRVD